MTIIRHAVIDTAASGDTELVAAIAEVRISVIAANFIAAGAVNAKFTSDEGSGATDLTGPYPLIAQSGASLGYCPQGHFKTRDGESLVLNLDAAVQMSGSLTYILE